MTEAAKPGVTSVDPNAGRDASDAPIDYAKDGNRDNDPAVNKTDDGTEDAVKVQIVEPSGFDEPEPPETTTIDQDYVYMHNLDPARAIPGTNKYLDVEQRKAAEIDRAAVEGREPDLDNPPAAQGTPLRSAQALAAELPPHATVKADVTLPVTVTKEEAKSYEDREELAKELQTQVVFNDPTKAQDREDVVASSSDTEGNTDTEGGSNAEGNVNQKSADTDKARV